ncbi:SnoaL-like domain-containing protein [Streptomyces asoensis]|uniref:SnoaL-like domain-containing protein n=1 Tax=Streptomyces asoensis TaxID=249586 RepID=A0A6M4X1H3_9ACTN|nr:nuclear transport factor 2 family protein [Streptomyces asoensis]QJS98971.1 SnoaL-like domain-containing protein [Streptomyces asoensis]QJT06498.1 SnoaL-like domain-containing protein [Streptomyces asoensis]
MTWPTGPDAAPAPSAALYPEVSGFYARQMQRLDSGDAQGWAATFTEDALFHLPTRPEPMRGRAALESGARTAAAAIAAAGERRRHVTGMFVIDERPDGALDVRAYTVIYATRIGGASRVHQVCVCEDVLVRAQGGLRVRSRRVSLDDQATGQTTGQTAGQAGGQAGGAGHAGRAGQAAEAGPGRSGPGGSGPGGSGRPGPVRP